MAQYSLYSYFRSSCSARLRIMLHLKNIPFDTVPVNILKNQHSSGSHIALNPSGSVPLLLSHRAEDQGLAIGQSVAAMEYLDDVFALPPTLPPAGDAVARAVVRTLVNIICCDVQPVTNRKIMRRVTELGGNADEWNRELMTAGLRAYEQTARPHAGVYSFGDDITMADICLVPAVWNAERYGIDVEAEFPLVFAIAHKLSGHEAVIQAHWARQPDTPLELRLE
ncbi:hypothetical protein CDD82_3617 [Ophiocordyceps australis]|uniref:Maleylacetoacetate isomerase n=1 Tax=Ophiocordyceps australis TaxID=1399860 RepID=A0A2C5ZTA1_9HYPO|nr:hypothetical protein CDD82_3617 [Ophiocordyceps australis]